MTNTESKALKTGNRVYWQGDAADRGSITETSWDAVTIAWNNGKLARVHHGDMREIRHTPVKPVTAQIWRPPDRSPRRDRWIMLPSPNTVNPVPAPLN